MHELRAGDEFGGYVIEGVAGRGGMGLVYRARQRRPDRLVAIKVIAPELVADPSFRARFERESIMAAEIEHPNVIPVYEVGEEDGRLFISMRYVDGVDLRSLLGREGRMPMPRAAALIVQVARALDAAHARGLIHRDVKPGNILVAAEDQVYLTDFGLTKRVGDSQGMTRTGALVGTVDYIAPEQVQGGPLDARADVYALGCVTYELLTGHVPFPRDSEVSKIFAHVNDPPPRLQGVPEPLADAVQRAMAKRPDQRFLSAGDLGRAVASGAQGQSEPGPGRSVAVGPAAIRSATTVLDSGADGGQSRPRGLRWPSSRRALLLGLGLVIVLAAVGGSMAAALGGGSSASHGTGTRSSGVTAANSGASSPAGRSATYYGPSCATPGVAAEGYSMCRRSGSSQPCPAGFSPQRESDGTDICLRT